MDPGALETEQTVTVSGDLESVHDVWRLVVLGPRIEGDQAVVGAAVAVGQAEVQDVSAPVGVEGVEGHPRRRAVLLAGTTHVVAVTAGSPKHAQRPGHVT